MAEIFGAVASGAGLVSLSMQLLESTQKLKGFYDSSRDAPETVRNLCFDLETMSLSLRQIERHRQIDLVGDELLGRCVVACERAIANIKAATDKMERLMRKAQFAGRLYTAFRDPEVRRLLEDMEHAKSSMSLAYMSYCQSWNMRKTLEHSNALTLQFEGMKLLQHTVESGNAALVDRFTAFAPQQAASDNEFRNPHERTTVSFYKRNKRNGAYKCRVTLPRWFAAGVWEFTLQEVSQVWTAQVRPVNIRPAYTYAFDFVRRGDTAAVRELLRKGELSVYDQAEDGSRNSNLLEIAAKSGSLELCRFLLQISTFFHDETMMHSALRNMRNSAYYGLGRANNALVEAAYSLFVEDHGLEYDFKYDGQRSMTSQYALIDRTEESIRIIMASQPVSLASLTPTERFSEVIESVGLPPDVFSKLLYHDGSNTSRTKAKSDGKTALHWAAAHFGEWSQEWLAFASPDSYASQQAEKYRRLASTLIAKGADVHALWQPHPPHYFGNQTVLDPFVSLLAGVFGSPGDLPSLSNAVLAWGEMLVDGGYSLPEYIETENEALRSLCYTCFHAGRRHRVVKLVLFGETRLAIEVARSYSLSIWRAHPNSVPGAWPMSWPPSLPDTLIWRPSTLEEQESFQWVETGEVNFESIPYRVQPTAVPDSAQALEASFHDARQRLFDLAQDDHGIVASIWMRDRNAVQGNGHRLRRRARSAPPIAPFMTEAKLNHQIYDSSSRSFSSASAYESHKCSFDARWTSRHGGDMGRCTRGHFDNFNLDTSKPGTNGWVVDLFKDEDRVPIARRFAERFCPDQLYRVQRTSERATQRARLAMGPHRKPQAHSPGWK